MSRPGGALNVAALEAALNDVVEPQPERKNAAGSLRSEVKESRSVATSNQGSAAVRVPAVAASPEVFVFPPSFAQQRLWLLDRLLPTGSVYNVATALRLVGRWTWRRWRRR